jgi:hypothetical protein
MGESRRRQLSARLGLKRESKGTGTYGSVWPNGSGDGVGEPVERDALDDGRERWSLVGPCHELFADPVERAIGLSAGWIVSIERGRKARRANQARAATGELDKAKPIVLHENERSKAASGDRLTGRKRDARKEKRTNAGLVACSLAYALPVESNCFARWRPACSILERDEMSASWGMSI